MCLHIPISLCMVQFLICQILLKVNKTGFLAPANFNGAFFTCAHFQKIAQISSLCYLLHFVAFYGVASLFVSQVDNRKEGVDNRKVK